jgi:hypothetical protein
MRFDDLTPALELQIDTVVPGNRRCGAAAYPKGRLTLCSCFVLIGRFQHGGGQMNEQVRAYLDEQVQRLDADVRLAIEMCDGDVMQALRTTLIANALLLEENERLMAQAAGNASARASAEA